MAAEFSSVESISSRTTRIEICAILDETIAVFVFCVMWHNLAQTQRLLSHLPMTTGSRRLQPGISGWATLRTRPSVIPSVFDSTKALQSRQCPWFTNHEMKTD